jgi:anti-sigma factor RsiW
MNQATDVYREWDAAYVLGALSSEDRREYERHLADCPACTAAMAELAGLPGLLGAVPAEEAVRLSAGGETDAAESPAPNAATPPARANSLPRLLAAARRQRRRSRTLIAGAIVAAAGLAASVALIVTGGQGLPEPGASHAAVALEQVVPGPLSADIRLIDQEWGTRIDMECSYAADRYGTGERRPYAMYVTDVRGEASIVASWFASPGTTVAAVGSTSLAGDEIARVDIRSVATGRVLLEADLNG